MAADARSQRMVQLMYSALVKTNKASAIEPDLALSWDVPDPLTYIFHLREGVKFHDGRMLTARDVVYTFRTTIDGTVRTANAGSYRMVASIEATDDKTVVFKLKEPFAPFLWNLTRGTVGIIPEGSGPEIAANPVGSGAFRFVHYVQDGELVLRRNDDYYGALPRISTVKFKIIPEAIVRALELRKGTVDVALNVLPPDMVEALRGQDGLRFMVGEGTNYQYIAFNLQDPVFKDIRVRKAIAHAIDREKIVKYLMRGQARLATGVIPPNNWAYEPNAAEYPYDPPRARELLAEAGFENLAFTFKTSTDETTRLLAAILQQQLREVGIQMEIRSNEFATFFADVQNGNFQAYSLQWVGGNNDPDILNLIFHSNMTPPNGANRGHYSNQEVDRLIEMARKETSSDSRALAYRRIQQIIADELPYISLWYVGTTSVHNPRIEGMTLHPTGDYEFLTEISAF
jgi:peptide/nickel transport system substrate-binding protein